MRRAQFHDKYCRQLVELIDRCDFKRDDLRLYELHAVDTLKSSKKRCKTARSIVMLLTVLLMVQTCVVAPFKKRFD